MHENSPSEGDPPPAEQDEPERSDFTQEPAPERSEQMPEEAPAPVSEPDSNE